MPLCPDTIKRLVDRFAQQSDTICSPDYNETLIRIDFINPLMSELGWDIDNRQGFAEQYREVVHEDRVRVSGQTKAPDRQIDQLVYQLYGLTDDEIAIVEAATR